MSITKERNDRMLKMANIPRVLRESFIAERYDEDEDLERDEDVAEDPDAAGMEGDVEDLEGDMGEAEEDMGDLEGDLEGDLDDMEGEEVGAPEGAVETVEKILQAFADAVKEVANIDISVNGSGAEDDMGDMGDMPDDMPEAGVEDDMPDEFNDEESMETPEGGDSDEDLDDMDKDENRMLNEALQKTRVLIERYQKKVSQKSKRNSDKKKTNKK